MDKCSICNKDSKGEVCTDCSTLSIIWDSQLEVSDEQGN